jgi:hypothetical protein
MSYNPLIATSGETALASQVLSKGTIARACWHALGAEPWACPCANRYIPSLQRYAAAANYIQIKDNDHNK